MTTMTIHVEDRFADVLRAFALKRGTSVNQTIKSILSPVLGIENEAEEADGPYSDLLGALSHSDAEIMKGNLSSLRTIDAEIWK